ncbi:MAG TPA: FHA domain-containing protein [Planctomycetes bacterium]|nr:FHA domain-containing protein [Planctomycetota bacterium]
MDTATLLVINGPNRGTRFDVARNDELIIGRSVGTHIRVDDTEMSRQHAKVFEDRGIYRLQDLDSANGTFVNGQRVTEHTLLNGDSIRLGTTLLTFQLATTDHSSGTAHQVQFVDDSHSGQHSEIVQTVHAEPALSETAWPDQQIGLQLLYEVAEELVRPAHTLESLMQRILQLTLDAVRADRGCILLKDPVGDQLTPLVFCQRRPGALSLGAVGEPLDGSAATADIPADDVEATGTPPHEQMPISRSITGYVLRHGKAVRTSDARHDARFEGGQSIAASGIREAICAPMRGHDALLGVFYIDISTDLLADGTVAGTGSLSDEHLKSVLAVARQSALAVESRRFHDALLKAERFAAMGQTIAVLSHHIKNILQGVRGGGYLIQTGLDQSKDDLVRQGWGIVERNQNRIYDLVMDMLSFTKDRVPDLQSGDVNRICAEVAELAATPAAQYGVNFEFRPEAGLPLAAFDHEGIHRSVLNVALNAIDAVAESENATVVLQTSYDKANDIMLVAVTDNGPGIPEDHRATVFNLFESSKGERGTGIGLPVSRKIIREHGGRIRIEGGPGEGTRFVLSWPRGNPSAETVMLDSPTQTGQDGSSINELPAES